MKMKSLKTKLTVYVVLIVTVAIMICTFANVIFTQHRLAKEETELLKTEAEHSAEEINSWLLRELEHVEDLATILSVAGVDDAKTIQNCVNLFFKGKDNLLDIYVGLESDGSFYRGNKDLTAPADYDPRIRGWYMEASKGESSISSPYKAVASGLMVATISAPIIIDEKLVGVVGCDITLDEVLELTENIDVARDAHGFLVDKDGYIVAHRNTDYLPNGEVTVPVNTVLPQLEKLFSGQETNTITANDYDGTRSYFASASVETGGWIFCISEPIANTKILILNEVALTFAVGVVCLIIVIALMVHIIAILLKPAEKMVKVITDLSNGYFDEHLDRTARQDELGELQNSLANLIGILHIVIEEETYILGEVAMGNLDVEEMTEYPGQFNDLSLAVNSIPVTLNGMLQKIQDAAINLESTIIALESAETPAERTALADLQSQEVAVLVDLLSEFKTKQE